MRRLTPYLLLVSLLLAPARGHTFGSATHRAVTKAALRGILPGADRPVPCTGNPDLTAFFRYLHGRLSSASDADAARDFLARWPSPGKFDAYEAKGFLDLTRNPEFRVNGFDFLACNPVRDGAELVREESVRPDDDGRNQARIAMAQDRSPLGGTHGPYPEDPAVMDLGGLEGLASQAHAHYTLASHGLTASPVALWRQPELFAAATVVPDGPLTLGPAMVKAHFIMALFAASWDDPASRRLSLAYLGHALHYIQDASTPMHTVQAGAPCVVIKALTAFAGRALVTLGGYAGDLKHPFSVAADFISNYHLWIETAWDERGPWIAPEWTFTPSRTPGIATGPWRDHGSALDAAMDVADEAADRVRHLGPELYKRACEQSLPVLGEYGFELEDGRFRAEDYFRDSAEPNAIIGPGGQAVQTAVVASITLVRAYARLAAWASTPEGGRTLADRLLKERLPALSAREARLMAFMDDNPDGVSPKGPQRFPSVVVLEALVLLLVAWATARLVRRLRRPNRKLRL
ncbi:MAG: hypothetical protein ISR64_11135 [Deltaproteobacteria bacterium]|nr:hypothetical protein [Deltaproteobacteria bacterium]